MISWKVTCLLIIFTISTTFAAEEFTKEHKELLETIKRVLSANDGSSSGANSGKRETPLERTERLNQGFERIIQIVNILGQVDSFLTDRAKTVVRKLSAVYDTDDQRSRRSRVNP